MQATPPRGVRTTWHARRRLATIFLHMGPERACEIAGRLLAGVDEPDGTPLLLHVARVAAATPPSAQAVAWLHEVLETGAASEHELLEAGLTTEQLRALRLLSRPGQSQSDRVYLAHLELIARAAGRSGQLARVVGIADLEDRHRHPRVRPDGWSPPYATGRQRLLLAGRAD